MSSDVEGSATPHHHPYQPSALSSVALLIAAGLTPRRSRRGILAAACIPQGQGHRSVAIATPPPDPPYHAETGERYTHYVTYQ